MPVTKVLYLVAVALTVASCGGGGDKSTGPTGNSNTNTNTFGGSATATLVDVNMPGLVYNPNNISVAQGGTVRFIFTAVAHDVRFNGATGAPADIEVVSNVTVSRTFANKGTFNFLCTLHAGMTGVVTVH
jgi:plastocyanin